MKKEIKKLDRSKIESVVKRAPNVGRILKKLASKVARGVRLPEKCSAKGLGYAEQRELESLFGTIGKRTVDGHFFLPLKPEFHERAIWHDAIEFFNLKDVSLGFTESKEDVFARLKLLEPELEPYINALAMNDEVSRFVAKPENRKDWMHLFLSFAHRFEAQGRNQITTLSQLGSDWFDDSKKLRNGGLRRQLVVISATFCDLSPDDERVVLEDALIVDNPYTSCVTFSLPVSLIMEDGTIYDYPKIMFARGLAVQLPLESVQKIKSIELTEKISTIITSENAAPFAVMVKNGVACVYTSGYPCLAVKKFLSKLAVTGAQCIHEGDADLDGFRIANDIGGYIPLKRVVASDIILRASENDGRDLTEAQKERSSAFLDAPQWKDFPYTEDVRKLLELGRWIEQESFDSILNKDCRWVDK